MTGTRRVATHRGIVLDVSVSVLGWAHGQFDMRMTATAEGTVVGALTYAVWNGEPSISMIRTKPEAMRRGVATAMLRLLQEDHPDREIGWGMLTEDGADLRRSIGFFELRDPARDADAARLALLVVEAEAAEATLASEMSPGLAPEAHAALLVRVEEIGAMHDEIRLLGARLEGIPERVLLITTRCADRTAPEPPGPSA